MIKGVDFIGIGVVFFCHDGNGNFILAKRSKNCRDEQEKYDVGGGAIEVQEKVEEVLIREIKEEYCSDVIDFEFLGYRDVHRINNDKKTHWIVLDFKVLVNRSQVKIGEPHKFDEIGWFKLNKLPLEEQLHSQLRFALELYKDKL